MEKRLVLAIAFSILIILSFQYFVAPQKPVKIPEAVKEAAVTTAAPKESEITTPPPPGLLSEEKEINIETEKYILTFSNIGGSIKDIKLKKYKELDTKEPLTLAKITNPKEYVFAINSRLGQTALDLATYDVEAKGDAITYTLRADGFKITKKYILHNSIHSIELQLYITNISSTPKEFKYAIIGGSGLTEKTIQDKRLIEVSSKIDGKVINYRRPKIDERIFNPGMVSWVDLKNKYFSLILKPFGITSGRFYIEDANNNLCMGVDSEKITIQPGSVVENKFVLYAGPSSITVLKELGYGLEETINYGFFGGISKALLVVLRFFYAIVHNWGVSIILLSVFLNIILFPLTMKSFKSMQKMQELHPQMEKLKVQLKDNPQKLNKEIMELYKKYNINPVSGCLPMLLQMPIFIALYQALMKSIELRSAGFLWIKDLSSPEAIPIPLSFPIIGNTINILPLVMVAAMVIQQKMSTKSMGSAITDEQKQQQKIMLIIMPIMFGFIFYNMPSGLVLYWVVNTVLTIVEQSSLVKSA